MRQPRKTAKKRVVRGELDHDRIAHAAFALIDRQGLESLTMRHLAETLGCEAMSLYHHFPSKAHLLDELVDRVCAQVEWPENYEQLPWRQRIDGGLRSYRSALRKHPRFAPYMLVHRMNTPAALRLLEKAVGAFCQLGLHDKTAAFTFRSLSYYVGGAVLDETAGYARGPSTAKPLTLQEQSQLAPNLIRIGRYFGEQYWEHIFDQGLRLMLDALEQRIGIS